MNRRHRTTRRMNDAEWRSTRALAVVTGAVACCFLAVGGALVLWGGHRLWIFGWILAAWGVAGIGSAVVIAMRPPRE